MSQDQCLTLVRPGYRQIVGRISRKRNAPNKITSGAMRCAYCAPSRRFRQAMEYSPLPRCGDPSLPQFVKDEFDAFLECGILAHDVLWVRCAGCGHEKLVAFSCKRRGICPSCGARRMAESAAWLVDRIIPKGPVRQWVLSFPIPLPGIADHPPGDCDASHQAGGRQTQ